MSEREIVSGCPECEGDGLMEDGGQVTTCDVCQGSGLHPDGRTIEVDDPCEACGGSRVIVIDHNGPGTDGTLPYERFTCPLCSEESPDGE